MFSSIFVYLGIRIGRNGEPIFRAWLRTLIMERLNTAATPMIDIPCSTKALRRSLSALIQDDPDFERTVLTLFQRLETALNPARDAGASVAFANRGRP